MQKLTPESGLCQAGSQRAQSPFLDQVLAQMRQPAWHVDLRPSDSSCWSLGFSCGVAAGSVAKTWALPAAFLVPEAGQHLASTAALKRHDALLIIQQVPANSMIRLVKLCWCPAG